MNSYKSDTPQFASLFIFVGLPTGQSTTCINCGKPVRESYTKEKRIIFINEQARPVQLIEEAGHRFGKFPAMTIHSHDNDNQ